MRSRGLTAIFDEYFLGGAVFVLTLWAIGAYTRASNWLVWASLLVSSRRPHLVTLPDLVIVSASGTGMNAHTALTLLGVMFVFGGLGTLLKHFVNPEDTGDNLSTETPREGSPPIPPMGGFPPMPPSEGFPPMPPSPPSGTALP